MNTSRRNLVVVSNRIPVTFAHQDGQLTHQVSSGGLVSALEPLLADCGGTWVGAAGTSDSPEIRDALRKLTEGRNFSYAPLFLTPEEQGNFYLGFSNEILWPLFHDLQSRCNFNPRYWDFYRDVNRKFAAAAVEAAAPDDLFWIQDYQLMQTGKFLRELLPAARLAFFLHIPFPSPDIFAKLPWRREILAGLLEYDLIGLQTRRDARNLVACLRCFVPAIKLRTTGEGHVVVSELRQAHIQSFPISIDFEYFAQTAASEAVLRRTQAIRLQNQGVELALGLDRLDYTKGIPERIKAFGSLLREHPELRRRVSLMQVVVPSRGTIPEYQDLKAEVERLVASVNGEFSEPEWIPINYIHRPIPRDELVAMYCAADIAIVTPLKDGMNLVAKEYCASKIDGSGVLILSEFAGAAPELRGDAILVNPYDERGVAAAIQQALGLSSEQKRRRMLHLRDQIRQANILYWRDRVLAALENSPAQTNPA